MFYKNFLLLLLFSSLWGNALAEIRYEGLSTRCLVKTQAENFMYAGIEISGGEKEVKISTQTVSQIANNQFIPRMEVKTFPEAVSVYRDNNPNLSTELETTLTLAEGFYTITVSPATAAEGIAIVNVYETEKTVQTLDSISTRCYIGTEDENAMFAGIQVNGDKPRAEFMTYRIDDIPNNQILPSLHLQTFPDGQFFNEVKSLYHNQNIGHSGNLELLHHIQDLQEGLYTATVQPSNQAGIGIITVAKPKKITPVDSIYISNQEVTHDPSRMFNIRRIIFSEDGRTMLLGFDNLSAQIWDMETGERLQTIENINTGFSGGSLGYIESIVQFMPSHANGRLVLSANSYEADVQIWDRQTDERIKLSLPGRLVGYSSTSVSPDSQYVVLNDNSYDLIQVWEISTDTLIQTIQLDTEARTIRSISFDPTGKLFAASTYSNRLYIWDTLGSQNINVFENVTSFKFDPTGKWLVTIDEDNSQVHLWDTNTFTKLHTFSLPNLVNRSPILFHPSENLLLTVADEAILWELPTAKPVAKLVGYNIYDDTYFNFHPEGQFVLASATSYKPMWDLTDVNNLSSIPTAPLEIAPLQTYVFHEELRIRYGYRRYDETIFSPDWQFIIKTTFDDNGLRIDFKPFSSVIVDPSKVDILHFTPITPKTPLSRETLQPLSKTIASQVPVSSFAISPDRHTIAINSIEDNSNILLWDVSTNTEIGRLNSFTSKALSLSFSPNGRILAFPTWDNTIQLLDITTGQLLFKLEGHQSWPKSISFNADGNILFARSGHTVYLWNVTTGKLESTLVHAHDVRAIAYDPNENILASSSGTEEQSIIQLWNISTEQSISTLEIEGNTYSIAFHPNGETLAINNDKLGVILLDKSLENQEILGDSDGQVEFSSDGRMLLSTQGKLWDMTTKKAIINAELNKSGVKFTSDKHMIASLTMGVGVDRFDTQPGIELSDISDLYQLKSFPIRHIIQESQGIGIFALNPDETLLATGSNLYENQIHLWDIATGIKVLSIERITDSFLDNYSPRFTGKIYDMHPYFNQLNLYNIISLQFSPSSKELLAVLEGGNTYVWNTTTGEQINLPQVSIDSTTQLNKLEPFAWSPNGQLTATISEQYDYIQLTDTSTNTVVKTLVGAETNSVLFTQDSKTLISSAYENSIVRFWDVETGELKDSFDTKYHSQKTQLYLSSSGKYLLLADTNDIHLLDISQILK